MNRLRLQLLAGCVLAAGFAASAAQAEVTTAASIGVFSDYRLRGVSLSDKKPVLQGSLEAGVPVSDSVSLFAGVWASSLDKDAGFGASETDWYAGAKGTIGKIGWSAKYLRLVYYDAKGLDFDQYAAEVTFPVGPLGGAIGVVHDEYTPGHSTYLYGAASYAFPDTPFAVKGTLGYEDGTSYNDKINWGIGASYTYQKITVGLEYQDTNRTVPGSTGKNLAGSTAVFSVTSAF
jgi:uncharacterized protein (TIGR02001 family)